MFWGVMEMYFTLSMAMFIPLSISCKTHWTILLKYVYCVNCCLIKLTFLAREWSEGEKECTLGKREGWSLEAARDPLESLGTVPSPSCGSLVLPFAPALAEGAHREGRSRTTGLEDLVLWCFFLSVRFGAYLLSTYCIPSPMVPGDLVTLIS